MTRPKLAPGEKGAKERLADAFWSRALAVPLSDITVDALSADAGCNRSTFYYHFDGIDDLRAFAIERSRAREIVIGVFGRMVRGEELEPAPLPVAAASDATVDDLCTMLWLNEADLSRIGAGDGLRQAWEQANGRSLSELSDVERASVEFVITGFLGALAYRGSVGNSFPYRELAGSLTALVNGVGQGGSIEEASV